AGRSDVPAAAQYDGFPVLSNGVGLLRSMRDEWRTLMERRSATRAPRPRARGVAWLTGRLAAPALEHMADAWRNWAGWRPHVEVVDNEFFGSQVTVSGLLSGADMVRTLRALSPEFEEIVLPRGPFGFDGRQTLDGFTPDEVGAAHPGRVHL